MDDLKTPWHEGGNNAAHGIVDANGSFVCYAPAERFAHGVAHVLAAAPDLLAALQMAVRSQWLSIDHERNLTPEACAIRSAMCAAIDKAERGGA